MRDRSRGDGRTRAAGLAVADALTARDVYVTLAGSPDRAEAQLVPDAGYELDTFRISGFPRQPSPQLVSSVYRAGLAPWACRAILGRRLPTSSSGAAASLPARWCSRATMRIPTALSEADAHLGLANRMALRFAGRLYPRTARRPERAALPGSSAVRSRPARARSRRARRGRSSSFRQTARSCLVAGALAGARSLNEAIIEAFGERGPSILHISGERDYWSLKARVKRPDYRLIPSTERIGAAYSAADLAVARAGAVWELAAAGKPAILVPYPFATADHQAKNAEYFVRAGGAIMVRDLDIHDVVDHVRSLLGDEQRLAGMSEAMLRVARPNAAEEIAEGLIALARA